MKPAPVHFRNRRGSALLIVLWAVVLLSGAVLSLAIYFQDGQEEQLARAAAFRCGQLAESGIAIAMHPQVERSDPLLVQDFGNGQSFHTRIISEGTRLNLNAIVRSDDKDLLLDVLSAWGLDLNEASPIVDAIFDWVDEDNLRRLEGAEENEYAAAGKQGLPRNKPFDSPEEVSLVLGWKKVEELKPDWKRYFTIWGSGKIDANDADADLLMVVTGATQDQVDTLIRYRDGEDATHATEDDNKIESVDQVRTLFGMGTAEFARISDRLSTEANVIRIESTGKVGRHQKTLEAIVRKGDQPAVYAWLTPPAPPEEETEARP